jgi:hypothetical protein
MIVPEGRDAPIFDKTIEFIRQNKSRPFYVNLWAFSTHAPVFAHDKHLSRFKDLEVNKKDFSDWMQKKFRIAKPMMWMCIRRCAIILLMSTHSI